ncbi:MAG: glycosyltransferase family 2 protein [Patescibacteria group bacterium]|nr:glycosyltransferase family 2 protein [Patescibacteria group bacterium]
MTDSYDIVFIILTYYPNEKSVDAIISAISPHPIIVVDNTPKRNVPFEGVVYLPNEENLGYAGGMNAGLRHAYDHGASWMVVLNDDLVLNRDTIRTFVKHLNACNPGLVGPFSRSLDTKRWTASTKQSSIDFLSGSFLAIHRLVIETIGYFYEPYFMFYEDVEYCVRARKHGFTLQTIKLPTLQHNESSRFQNKKFLHEYYLARNHYLFVERNAPIAVQFHELIRFPKTIYEHLKKKEWGALAGIRDYCFRTFGKHKHSI